MHCPSTVFIGVRTQGQDFYMIFYSKISRSKIREYFVNFRQIYDNIYKLLRPGGKSLIMFVSFNDGFDAYTKMHNDSRYAAYMQVEYILYTLEY